MKKTFALLILSSLLLVGCTEEIQEEEPGLEIYTSPEGATSVSTNEATFALQDAANNFGNISSLESKFAYSYDDTILYNGALQPYATKQSIEAEYKVDVYSNDVIKASETVTQTSSLNEVYVDTSEANHYYLLDEYSSYNEDTQTYDTLYRTLYYSEETVQGITSVDYGIRTTYDTSSAATLGFNSLIESTVLDCSNPSGILANSTYFNASTLISRNSYGFTKYEGDLYFTYYSISNSTITNPSYPNDETKTIALYSVTNYQIVYSSVNGSYFLSSIKAQAFTYVTHDFNEQAFSEPYIIGNSTSETIFYHNSRSSFNETLNFDVDNIVSYTVSVRVSASSTYTIRTFTDYTETYKSLYNSSYSGLAYYGTFNISSYYSGGILTLTVSGGDLEENIELTTLAEFTVNDRLGKVTASEDGEAILGTGTYSLWVLISNSGTVTQAILTYLY